MFHSLDHLTDHRVLSVQKIRIRQTDEKLAVGTVRTLGAGHAQRPAQEGRIGKLRLEVLSGAPRAGAGRVPCLSHEAGDDTMEHDAVIESIRGKFEHPGDMAGGQIRPKADRHLTALQNNLQMWLVGGDSPARNGSSKYQRGQRRCDSKWFHQINPPKF